MPSLKELRYTLLTWFYCNHLWYLLLKNISALLSMLQSHAIVKRSVDLKSGVMTYRTVPASVSNVADVTASGAEQCVSSFIIFFGWLSHAGMRSDVEPRSSYPSTPTELVHQENTSYFSGSFDSGLLMSYSCSKELKSLPVETTLTGSLLFNHLL